MTGTYTFLLQLSTQSTQETQTISCMCSSRKKKRKNIYTTERWKVASVTLQQVVSFSLWCLQSCCLYQPVRLQLTSKSVQIHNKFSCFHTCTFSDVTLLNCTWEHEWVLSNLVPACSAQVPPPIKMQFKSCKSVKGQHLDLVVEKYS